MAISKTNLDIITRLIILGSILLIAFSVFYFLVIYLPGKERQKVETQKQQELALKQAELQKKKDEAEKKTQFDFCLSEAENQYTINWNNECKTQGLLSASCIKLVDMTYEEWRKENNIPKEAGLFERYSEFSEKKDDCSCGLPSYKADRVEEWRKDAKAECFKKYQ